VCMCMRAADFKIQMEVVYFLYWPVKRHKADSFVGFRIFLLSSQKLSTDPFFLYYIIYSFGTPYYTSIRYIQGYLTGLSDNSTSRNNGVSATVAEFESHLPNVVTLSSKLWLQATFGLVA
jgi:hypothetical protein